MVENWIFHKIDDYRPVGALSQWIQTRHWLVLPDYVSLRHQQVRSLVEIPHMVLRVVFCQHAHQNPL
jgi:hypothetical protein